MNKFKIEIKWAFIFTAIFLAWMWFEKAMGWHGENIENQSLYTNIFGVFAVVLYVLALRDKRENYFSGIMSWQQGLVSGAILSVIIAAITPFSQFVVHRIISPDYFENISTYSVQNEKMTTEIAKEYFNLSSYIFQSAFFALSSGIVTAAIVAWFLKKNPKNKEA